MNKIISIIFYGSAVLLIGLALILTIRGDRSLIPTFDTTPTHSIEGDWYVDEEDGETRLTLNKGEPAECNICWGTYKWEVTTNDGREYTDSGFVYKDGGFYEFVEVTYNPYSITREDSRVIRVGVNEIRMVTPYGAGHLVRDERWIKR